VKLLAGALARNIQAVGKNAVDNIANIGR